MNAIGQHRRIFLLRCSLKVYTVTSFFQSLNVRCRNAEPILRLDPPTNAAIGPSPAQRRAATSENPTTCTLPDKDSPHSITERRVPELIPVLGSQPAGDVSHKPGGRLQLLSARPAGCSYPEEGCYRFCCLVNRGTMGVNSSPKTVTRQRRDCDLNPGLLRLSPAR